MLNEWERHEFARIQETLTRQDPKLAARMTHTNGKSTQRTLLSHLLWTVAMVVVVPLLLVVMMIGMLALMFFAA